MPFEGLKLSCSPGRERVWKASGKGWSARLMPSSHRSAVPGKEVWHRRILIVSVSHEAFFLQSGTDEPVYFRPVERQRKCIFLFSGIATAARDQGDAIAYARAAMSAQNAML